MWVGACKRDTHGFDSMGACKRYTHDFDSITTCMQGTVATGAMWVGPEDAVLMCTRGNSWQYNYLDCNYRGSVAPLVGGTLVMDRDTNCQYEQQLWSSTSAKFLTPIPEMYNMYQLTCREQNSLMVSTLRALISWCSACLWKVENRFYHYRGNYRHLQCLFMSVSDSVFYEFHLDAAGGGRNGWGRGRVQRKGGWAQ